VDVHINAPCLRDARSAKCITRWHRAESSRAKHVASGSARKASRPPGASFDVAHARFVFLHQSKWREALEATLRLLRPGGHLVLEEPDFSVSRAIAGAGHRRDAFERVHRAIEAMFSESGMSFDFGARLPAIFQEYQLEDLAIANDVPIVRGGTPFARMMGMSTQQLGNKYVATGVATKRDLELYWDFAHDPNSWAIYHGTVRASGRLAARTP
jgi:SAM-dependent methyltransferase